MHLVEQFGEKHRDTGDPCAVMVGRIRHVVSLHGFVISSRDIVAGFAERIGIGAVGFVESVEIFVVNGIEQILRTDDVCVGSCLNGRDILFRPDVFFCKFNVGFVELLPTDAEEVPAVAEDTVVCPVGRPGADRRDGDEVHEEHDECEDRERRPAVGHDPVDLIGDGKLAGVLLLVDAAQNVGDIDITLIRDDALRVIVEFFLDGGDVALDMFQRFFREIQFGDRLGITLKELDGEPALTLFGQGVDGHLFDVREGVFHRAREGVGRDGFAALRRLDGGFCRFGDAGAFQRGDLHDLATECTGQLADVDFVAVLLHDVHHVDDDRDPEFRQLGREVEVSLEVGTVDDVEDRVRALMRQVGTGDDLFGGVRREGIDTGQVGDDDILMLFEFAFFLLDRDARPVTDELVGTRQGVEQGCLTGVRVTGKSDANLLFFHKLLCTPCTNQFVRERGDLLDFDHVGVFMAEGECVTAHRDLYGITEGSDADYVNVGATRDAHVHDAALDGALTVEFDHAAILADLDLLECLHVILLYSTNIFCAISRLTATRHSLILTMRLPPSVATTVIVPPMLNPMVSRC